MLTRPVWNANQELQNEKFLPIVWFQPGTFRIRSERNKRWKLNANIYSFSMRNDKYITICETNKLAISQDEPPPLSQHL